MSISTLHQSGFPVGRTLNFWFPNLRAVCWSGPNLSFHAKHALVPRDGRFYVSTIQDNVIDPTDYDAHLLSPPMDRRDAGLRGLRGVDAVQADALAVHFKRVAVDKWGLLFFPLFPYQKKKLSVVLENTPRKSVSSSPPR
jgi:hypothetical protein